MHRDIKPANIILDDEGWAIVTDFGIAKVAHSAGLTMTGATIGTPSYMSPEQCAGGDISGQSDQYSLGVVAYEMLTGTLLFSSTESVVQIIWAHFNQVPEEIDVSADGWKSSNPSIIRVTDDGLVAGLRTGSAKVAVQAAGRRAVILIYVLSRG